MSQTQPTYAELEQRCLAAEAMLAAIRAGQADMIVGEQGLLVLRLAAAEEKASHIQQLLIAMRKVNQLIAQEMNAERLMTAVCATLTETMGYHTAWIALFAPTTPTVTFVVGAGFAAEFAPLQARLLAGDWPACVHKIRQQGDTVILDDPLTECPDCPLIGSYHGRSRLARCLTVGPQVYGMLVVSAPYAYARYPEAQSLFAELANDLAFALHRIELEERRLAAENERLATLAALQTNEEKLHTLFALLPVGISVLDRERRVTEANPALEKILGLSRSELATGVYTQRRYLRADGSPMPPTEFPTALAMQTQRPITNVEVGIVKEDGETIWVNVTALPVTFADWQVLTTVSDITERKRAEAALRESETLVRTWMNAIQESAFIMDKAGIVLVANETVAQRFQQPVAAMIGACMYDLLPPPTAEQRRAHVAEVIASGRSARFEDERFGRVIDSTIYPVFDETGQVNCLAILGADITDRRQAEQQLRRQTAVLETLLNSPQETVALLDPVGHVLSINRNGAQKFGLSPQEMIGQNINDLLPQPVAQTRQKIITEVMRTGHSAHFEDQRGGMHFMNSIYPVNDPQSGALLGAAIFAVDITTRKQAEEEIRSARAFLEMVIDMSPFAMWLSDQEGTIRRVNQSLCQTLNLTEAAIIGHYNIFQDQNLARQGVMPNVQAVFQRREPARFTIPWQAADAGSDDFQRARDLHIDVSMFPILNAQGELTNVVCQWVDITERIQAEAEIRRLNAELEERVAQRTAELSDLYNNAPCGYHSLDDKGVYVRINDTELAWIGYNREEVIGKMGIPDLFTPASLEIFERNFPRLKAQGRLENLEAEMMRRDGSILPILFSATAVRDADGRFLMSRSTIIDYTARKQADLALRASQAQLEAANKELEAFAYSVSHDLRAPLRGIDGWSLALLEDYYDQLDETARQYLDRIRAEAQRMGRLIDDLLQLSRVTRAEMRFNPVNLSHLAHAVVARLQEREPNRPVAVTIQPDLHAPGDEALLEIALTNLLDNAYKFSNGRAPAQIEFGRLAARQGESLVYFVRDNGAGFNMAYAAKLFGAFQRLHKTSEFPGTGIGLAIVQRIIHRHNGRIWAEAQINQGATFYFTLGETL